MKPFRGKRRGPQSPSVGFSSPASRRARRRHPQGVRRVRAAGRRVHFRRTERHDRFVGGEKPPEKVTARSRGSVLQLRTALARRRTEGDRDARSASAPAIRSSVRPAGTVVSARKPRTSGVVGRSASTRGRWRIGRSPVRPVLKHGPRSLTCARVSGCYET